MKKIVAILLALAVVSMAFAQTVSISNKLSTSPTITINGGTSYWGFGDAALLRDEVRGEAVTADGRARVKGEVRFDLQTLDPTEESILSFKPRWSWNSQADNSRGEGNRSAVAAILKPWDFLEIGIGNLDRMGYAMSVGACKNLDWREWSTWFHGANFSNEIPGVVGGWQRLSSLVFDGIHVAYVGVPNLKIAVGLESARNEKNGNGGVDRDTLIKKGMFNGFSMGANYDSDLFAVGAIYKGNFGMERGTLAAENDKAFQDHTIYASISFKGLQEAKIGTTLYADVGFYTAKASPLVEWSYYDTVAKANVTKKSVPVTSFLFNVGAGFNFRNGISDDVAVSVGYYKIGGTSAKVLPFCVINTLNYSVSSDANFSFLLGYSQNGLAEKKTVAGATNTNALAAGIGPNGAAKTPTANGSFGWLVFAYPKFSWTMGSSTFEVGLKTGVDGDIVPHAKSGHEWAWTGLRGQQAYISFPLSWTYNF